MFWGSPWKKPNFGPQAAFRPDAGRHYRYEALDLVHEDTLGPRHAPVFHELGVGFLEREEADAHGEEHGHRKHA